MKSQKGDVGMTSKIFKIDGTMIKVMTTIKDFLSNWSLRDSLKIGKTEPVNRIFKTILFSTCNKRDDKKHKIGLEIIEQMELVDRNT